MASNAQAQPPVQQQAAAAPAPVPAAQPKSTRVSLSYEEISKLFSLPIAEAASILGVCTSVLKRLCRTHGIVRWPYRKLVSGKTGDDIKNAEREKAKELLELSKIAKQKALRSSGLSTIGSLFRVQPPICSLRAWTLGAVDWGGYQAIRRFPRSSKISTGQFKGRTSLTPSHRDSTPAKDEKREDPKSTHDASKGVTDDDELDWGADEAESEADSVVTTEPSAQLCSLRRKAVDDGRKLLNGDARRGQEFCRLHKRQKMVLAQVFGASLPEQWRSKLA